MKRILSIFIIMIFLCQDLAFCLPERAFALRAPSHFNEATQTWIEERHKEEESGYTVRTGNIKNDESGALRTAEQLSASMVEEGAIGVYSIGALSMSFFKGLAADFIIGRKRSKTTKSIMKRGSIIINGKETNVRPQLRRGLQYAEGDELNILPEIIMVCPNTDQIDDFLDELIEYFRYIEETGYLALDNIPYFLLASNGIYFEDILETAKTKIELSNVKNKKFFQDAVDDRLFRAVTYQLGERVGRGADADYKSQKREFFHTFLSLSGKKGDRERIIELMKGRGHNIRVENRRLVSEWDKALGNLVFNAFSQLHLNAVDQEGQEVSVVRFGYLFPGYQHYPPGFTPIKFRVSPQDRIREVATTFIEIAVAKKIYPEGTTYEEKEAELLHPMLQLAPTRVPSSLRLLLNMLDDPGWSKAEGLFPTEERVFRPAIDAARELNMEVEAKVLEQLRDDLIEAYNKAIEMRDKNLQVIEDVDGRVFGQLTKVQVLIDDDSPGDVREFCDKVVKYVTRLMKRDLIESERHSLEAIKVLMEWIEYAHSSDINKIATLETMINVLRTRMISILPILLDRFSLDEYNCHRLGLIIWGASVEGEDPYVEGTIPVGAIDHGERYKYLFVNFDDKSENNSNYMQIPQKPTGYTPYHVENGRLYYHGTELSFRFRRLPPDSIDWRFRVIRDGKELWLNPKDLILCPGGCVFCARANKALPIRKEMQRKLITANEIAEMAVGTEERAVLGRVEQVTVITDDFGSEEKVIAYMRQLKMALEEKGFQVKFYITGGEVVSEKGMRVLRDEFGIEDYCFTLERFSRREEFMSPYRANPLGEEGLFGIEGMEEIFQRARRVGFKTITINYIAGLESEEEFRAGLEELGEFIDYIRMHMFRPFTTYQETLRTPEAHYAPVDYWYRMERAMYEYGIQSIHPEFRFVRRERAAKPRITRYPEGTMLSIPIDPNILSGETKIHAVSYDRGSNKAGFETSDGVIRLGKDAVCSFEELVEEVAKRYPGRKITAVGNANVGQNEEHVYYHGGSGLLIKAEGFEIDPEHIFHCLVVYKNGKQEIAEVTFEKAKGDSFKIIKEGEDISGKVVVATSSVPIFAKGNSLDIKEIAKVVDDPRHLFMLPLVKKDGRMHFLGMSALTKNSPGRRDAMDGKGIWIEYERGLTLQEIENAFEEKGYIRRDGEDKVRNTGRGYFIDEANGRIFVIFTEGIYPHNLVGMTRNGNLVSTIVPGKSARTGRTMRGLQQIVEDYNVKNPGDPIINCLSMDTGGDTRFFDPEKGYIVRPAEAREWMISCIVFVEPHETPTDLEKVGLRTAEPDNEIRMLVGEVRKLIEERRQLESMELSEHVKGKRLSIDIAVKDIIDSALLEIFADKDWESLRINCVIRDDEETSSTRNLPAVATLLELGWLRFDRSFSFAKDIAGQTDLWVEFTLAPPGERKPKIVAFPGDILEQLVAPEANLDKFKEILKPDKIPVFVVTDETEERKEKLRQRVELLKQELGRYEIFIVFLEPDETLAIDQFDRLPKEGWMQFYDFSQMTKVSDVIANRQLIQALATAN